MGTALEIIGAFILTMMLISLVFKMQVSTYESNIEATLTYNQQSYSELLKEVLRNQIKNVGQAVTNIDQAILKADEKQFEFLADVNADNVIDTVSIKITDWDEDPTPNLDDKNVLFTVNGAPINSGFKGIVDFKFKYFDNHYEETLDTKEIQFVSYQFRMQSEDTFGENAGDEKSGERALAIGEGVVFLKSIWDW